MAVSTLTVCALLLIGLRSLEAAAVLVDKHCAIRVQYKCAWLKHVAVLLLQTTAHFIVLCLPVLSFLHALKVTSSFIFRPVLTLTL